MSVLGKDDFGQRFLYTTNDTRAMRITVPIIPAGDENNQWCDWKGLFKESKRCRSSLASKVPEMVDRISLTVCMSCSVSS